MGRNEQQWVEPNLMGYLQVERCEEFYSVCHRVWTTPKNTI